MTSEQARREADMAFDLAIRQGRLSADERAPNYAGHYMFMGTEMPGRIDLFKHRDTREYLALRGWAVAEAGEG